jgi:hypothetical protein
MMCMHKLQNAYSLTVNGQGWSFAVRNEVNADNAPTATRFV